MRRILPKEEYRLIKNRKCARESRKKRREKSVTMTEKLAELEAENKELKKKILNLECNKSDMSSYSVISSEDIKNFTDSLSYNSDSVAISYHTNKSGSSTTDESLDIARDTKFTTKAPLICPFMQTPIKSVSNTLSLKEQSVLPPRLSIDAMLSPEEQCEKQQGSFTNVCEGLKLKSFKMLSNEGTSEVLPLSPLSGSSNCNSDSLFNNYPNLMSW